MELARFALVSVGYLLLASACASSADANAVSTTPLSWPAECPSTSSADNTSAKDPTCEAVGAVALPHGTQLDRHAADSPAETALSTSESVEGSTAGKPQTTAIDPASKSVEDIAARVALSAFSDQDWPAEVAADLHPNFAGSIALTRTRYPSTQPGQPEAVAVTGDTGMYEEVVLVVLAVTQSPYDSDTWIVAFDEVFTSSDTSQEVRHVTNVRFSNTTPPLVLAIKLVA